MTSSNATQKIVLGLLALATLAACTAAKSPLADGDGATFAIYPNRVAGRAELGRATGASFGRARTQTLHFDVCLRSLATGADVAPGSTFTVGDGVGAERKRSTDTAGCLHWDEEHAVSPLAPERNVRAVRRIRASGNHRGTVTLTFIVKPWLEGSEAVQSALNQEAFNDVIDGNLSFADRYPTSGGVVAASDLDGTAQFDLADSQIEFTYVEIGQDSEFEVDTFLNLAIPYRYNFSFAPRITRKLFSGALKSETMTSGKLRVTFVFFASARGGFTDDKRYLTSVETEAEVGANGRVIGQVVVKYPHMLFASGRQTMLVQISAPGQAEVAPRSFAGSVAVIDHRGMLTAFPDGRDAGAIHRAATAERTSREAARPSPLAEYLRAHDVIRTDLADLPTVTEGEKTPSLLSRVAKNLGIGALPTRDFNEGLCRDYLKVNGVRLGPAVDTYCPKYGQSSAVTVRRFDFVESLVQKAPRKVSINTYKNIDFAVFNVNDKADSAALGFGIHLGLPEALTLGILSATVGTTRTGVATATDGGRFAESQTMAIDRGTLEVYANVRSCVLVTGHVPPLSPKPWLICNTNPSPATWIPEKYFYYSQMFGSSHSPLIDPFNAQTGLKLLVRGAPYMKRLTKRFADTDIRTSSFEVMVDAVPPNLDAFDTTGKVDDLTHQEIPGAIERE